MRREYSRPLHRPRLDGAVVRHRAVDRRRRAASGRTARASTTCAPTWRWSSRCRPSSIVVEHVEGAGCYGQNGADDVALEAALLARARQGRPVRLLWSREDEMAWAPFGAAQVVDIEADLDDEGRDRRLAPRRVGQRPRLAPRPRQDADAAGRLAARQAVPAPGRDQPAARRRRRLGAQRHAALRFPGLAHHQPSPAHHADPHLLAAHARRLRQRVRHRVVHGRAGRRARRGPASPSACAT